MIPIPIQCWIVTLNFSTLHLLIWTVLHINRSLHQWSEHSVVGVPWSLYNISKSVPDPLYWVENVSDIFSSKGCKLSKVLGLHETGSYYESYYMRHFPHEAPRNQIPRRHRRDFPPMRNPLHLGFWGLSFSVLRDVPHRDSICIGLRTRGSLKYASWVTDYMRHLFTVSS